MHGLIFETSIWLLAGSTRFLIIFPKLALSEEKSSLRGWFSKLNSVSLRWHTRNRGPLTRLDPIPQNSSSDQNTGWWREANSPDGILTRNRLNVSIQTETRCKTAACTPEVRIQTLEKSFLISRLLEADAGLLGGCTNSIHCQLLTRSVNALWRRTRKTEVFLCSN